MTDQDQAIRLQCLELAIKTPNAGTAGIVVVARQYADFVLGNDPDAMVPLGNRNYLGTGEFSQMSATSSDDSPNHTAGGTGGCSVTSVEVGQSLGHKHP